MRKKYRGGGVSVSRWKPLFVGSAEIGRGQLVKWRRFEGAEVLYGLRAHEAILDMCRRSDTGQYYLELQFIWCVVKCEF